MDDFYVELDPCCVRAKPDSPEQRIKNLIAAIIYQAFVDAKTHNFRGALYFLNAQNPHFVAYCDMIDYDPEWLAKYLKKAIHNERQSKYSSSSITSDSSV